MLWRIGDRATFEALRRSGDRARRGPVTVTYAHAGEPAQPRVAYAVGRRVGNAVTRNRVRRRLRAAVAEATELRPGAYLVAAGPEAARTTYDELRRHVATALTAANARARA